MEKRYLYIDKTTGAQKGPLSATMIKGLIKRGVLSCDIYVWTDGLKEWAMLSQLDDFKEYVQNITKMWMYLLDGEKKGPILTRKLAQLVVEGQLDGLSLVWSEGMTEWKPVGEIQILKLAIQEEDEEDERATRVFESKVELVVDETPMVSDTLSISKTTTNEEKHFDQETEFLDTLEKKEGISNTEEDTDKQIAKVKRKRNKKKNKDKWKDLKQDTWIYVNGLPLDITEKELHDHFSKCGIIQDDIFTATPRIKIYRDENGDIKGDASICYMKPPSVELAVQMLDGVEVKPSWPLSVSKAVFGQKEEGFVRKKKKVIDMKAKAKLVEQSKSLSWNENEDEQGGFKIVVFKNMFSPQDFEDEAFGTELEEDLVEECEKLGEIVKITLFSKNPQGVVIVKFSTSGSASLCIEKMNKRFFGGRQLECHYWDGTDYSNKESKEDLKARMDDFGNWLEEGSSSEDDDDNTVPPSEEMHSGRKLPEMED